MSTYVLNKTGRIVRFENGRKVSYKGGARIELSPAEAEKYKYIVSAAPAPAPAVKVATASAVPITAAKHEVRLADDTKKFGK